MEGTLAIPLEAASTGDDRRGAILRSLHDCVLLKGYANTTLADIARGAQMTPSHLLYYFKGKDAILGQYFDVVAEWVLDRVGAALARPREQRIHALADAFFGRRAIGKGEIGIMLEVFGIAVCHKELQRKKVEFDRRFKTTMEDLFVGDSAPPGRSPADAAESAYAMLVGLRTAAYFDERLSLRRAHLLFVDHVCMLTEVSASGGKG